MPHGDRVRNLQKILVAVSSAVGLILGCWQGYELAGILGLALGAPLGALLGLVLAISGWYTVYGLLALLN